VGRSQLGSGEDREGFAQLRSDLDRWLGRIVSRHGVEAAFLLYPEDQRAQKLIDEIDNLSMHFLPDREGTVGEVREEALRGFIRHPTKAQRVYLANRLNVAFELTVLTLDPSAIHLVKRQFNGHRVYLDTNFLYSLLGYASADESLAAHRLLAMTKELGFKLAVTPWTVEELRTSLRRSHDRIGGLRLPSRRYADLMIRAAAEKGFDQAFWVSYRDSNISRQDFFHRASHFEHDFEKLDIEIVKDGCSKVDNKVTLVQRYVSLLSKIGGSQWRETIVLEHDAKHRILIEQLRGDGYHAFSNGRFWFLTQDTRLPLFARATLDPGSPPPDLPFCMSSSAWAQIMRAFTPRTKDWEKMVVDLLASPYVGWQRGLDFSAAAEVVGRIDQYEGDGVDFAWKVLADTAIMAQISTLKTDGASDQEISDYIDGAFIEKAEEAHRRASEAELRFGEAAQREAHAQDSRRAERERAELLKTDRDNERGRRIDTESDLSRERRLRENADTETDSERKKREELEHRLGTVRMGIASVVAVCAIATTVLLLSTHRVHGGIQKLFVVLGCVLVVLVSVNMIFNEKWVRRIFVYLALLVGVAGIVVPLLFPSH
jgi:hypothetical protein